MSESFWVTRRSSSPKGCFSKNARICFSLSGLHLRRTNSRTSLYNGVGGSASFFLVPPGAVGQPASPAHRWGASRTLSSCRKCLSGWALGRFSPVSKLRDVGLRNLGGACQIALVQHPILPSRCLITKEISTGLPHRLTCTDKGKTSTKSWRS